MASLTLLVMYGVTEDDSSVPLGITFELLLDKAKSLFNSQLMIRLPGDRKRKTVGAGRSLWLLIETPPVTWWATRGKPKLPSRRSSLRRADGAPRRDAWRPWSSARTPTGRPPRDGRFSPPPRAWLTTSPPLTLSPALRFAFCRKRARCSGI